jgi:NTE family protein
MPIRFLIPLMGLLLLVGCAHTMPPHILIPAEPPLARPIHDVDIALVLGGGGARGIAHVGVLSVFEEEGVPIHLIVGSSAGSIVGGLYADQPNAARLKDLLLPLKRWDMLDPDVSALLRGFTDITGPVSGIKLQHFLYKNLKHHDFASLPIPLAVVTTDLSSNQAFVIRSGPLIPALHASSAIPLVFAPVPIYQRLLVDGGVIEAVPARIARQFHPKMVIAVDIGAPAPDGAITNMWEAAWRATYITYYELGKLQSLQADIRIHPETANIGIFDDENGALLYQKGREAAQKMMPQIKRYMQLRHIKVAPHSRR